MVCCQPPLRTAASSWAKLRVSAMMMPMVSSGIALPEPPVPHTVMPRRAAAATSIDAFTMPVVTSRRRAGSDSRIVAGNGVRSRIATTTSLSRSRCTSSAGSAMCSPMTSTVWACCTADQSVLVRATFW